MKSLIKRFQKDSLGDHRKPEFPVWLVDDHGETSHHVMAEFQLCADGGIRPVNPISWRGLCGRVVAVIVKIGEQWSVCSLSTGTAVVSPLDTVTINPGDWKLQVGSQADQWEHMDRINAVRGKLLEDLRCRTSTERS